MRIRKACLALAALSGLASFAAAPNAAPSGAFARLGYQLDVSRNKVPTLTSLKRIVDVLARCGYDEFQLYMECAYAYKGHEEVWKDWSPYTAEDIRELAAYCRARKIDLVPNQNSFAHLGPWMDVKSYAARLAEAPDGITVPKVRGPVTLCATSPESYRFLDGLYGDLLPNFTSDRFNVGCDEVYDILDPKCRSAEKVKKVGYGRTYFDYVRGVLDLVRKHGKTPMFWGDCILKHPELLKEVPKDAVVLNWWYDADGGDRFETTCAALEKAGVRFYVCPGTSSWQTFAGRVDNMMQNVDEAVAAGRRHGAEGLLLADWGDWGHSQPQVVSLPAIVYAAARARGRTMTEAELAREIDACTGVTCGEALVRLGKLWRPEGMPDGGWNQMFLHFVTPGYEAPEKFRPFFTPESVDRLMASVRAALARADLREAPEWIRDDFEVIDLLYKSLACRVRGDDMHVKFEFAPAFSNCWLRQNRPGRLAVTLQNFRAPPPSKPVTIKPEAKKLVVFGHQFSGMTPGVLLAHADAFDRTAIDGIGFCVSAPKGADARMSSLHLQDGPPWDRAAFAPEAAAYRAAFRHRSLRHSFACLLRAPVRRVAWTDDAGWAHWSSNVASVAWFAKAGGFAGGFVDVEDYTKARQFERFASDPDIDCCRALARRRGAEMFRGVFREFPDMALISFWLFSTYPGGYAFATDPDGAARDAGDLWPSFVNGILDVAPMTAKLVDGDEKAYRYEAERGDFFRASVEQRVGLSRLVAPENRAKYQALLRTSFGHYLEMYTNPEGNRHYFPPADGSRLRHFAKNLAQSVAAADEYLWLWTETRTSIDWDASKSLPAHTLRRRYEADLPGLDAVMRAVKEPWKLPPWATNEVAVSFGHYSDGKVKGTLVERDGVRTATGVECGGFTARVENVVPGDLYALACRARGRQATIGVSWKKGNAWVKPGASLALGAADRDGWRTGQGVVSVPPGVDTLVFVMEAARLAADEQVSYRDIRVSKFDMEDEK